MSLTFEFIPGTILGTMPRTIQGVREECLDATVQRVDTAPWLFSGGGGGGIPASIHSPTSGGSICVCVGRAKGATAGLGMFGMASWQLSVWSWCRCFCPSDRDVGRASGVVQGKWERCSLFDRAIHLIVLADII